VYFRPTRDMPTATPGFANKSIFPYKTLRCDGLICIGDATMAVANPAGQLAAIDKSYCSRRSLFTLTRRTRRPDIRAGGVHMDVGLCVRRCRGWRSGLSALAATLIVGITVAMIPVMSASAATVDTGVWYVLVNRHSGKALDLYNLATNDGAIVAQWTRNDGAWQQWQFVDSSGGNYRLKSRHSGKVLDVYNWSTADSAAIVQWTDANGANQQFRLLDSDAGYVRLLNRNSNKAVEVQGASTANGASIVQYSDWNGANQRWQLVRVDGTTPGGTLPSSMRWSSSGVFNVTFNGTAWTRDFSHGS
jgi:hypothetical protein